MCFENCIHRKSSKSRRGLKQSIKMSGERESPWNTPWDIEKGAEDQDGVTTVAERLE